jgi:hypothetical protein
LPIHTDAGYVRPATITRSAERVRLLRGYPTCQRAQLGAIVLILGIVLLIIGLILNIAILWTLGIILLIIGAALFLLGSTGRAVGGRRHYW